MIASARGDHHVDRHARAFELRQLRHEDEDRQRIDEAGHHRARDKAHDAADAQHARRSTWSTPVSTVAASRYCSPCSFTSVTMSSAVAAVAAEIMPGRPPKIARDHRDAERGVEPDLRIDARDDGKRDRLRDERQRHDDAREQIAADIGEPLFGKIFGEHELENHGTTWELFTARVPEECCAHRRHGGVPRETNEPQSPGHASPQPSTAHSLGTRVG